METPPPASLICRPVAAAILLILATCCYGDVHVTKPGDEGLEPEGSIDSFMADQCGHARHQAWQKKERAFGDELKAYCQGKEVPEGGQPRKKPPPASGGGSRIADGANADIDDFPMFVSLVAAGPEGGFKRFCGGHMISERLILTAAHCLFSRQSGNVFVVQGSTSYDGRNGGRLLEVQKWCMPASTGSERMEEQRMHEWDIALVQLKHVPSHFGNTDLGITWHTIRPACLRMDGMPHVRETTCQIAGFGNTNDYDLESRPATLQKLDIVKTTEGNIIDWKGWSTPTLYKVANNGTGGPCFGDSGGPVVCYDTCSSADTNKPRTRSFVVGHVLGSHFTEQLKRECKNGKVNSPIKVVDYYQIRKFLKKAIKIANKNEDGGEGFLECHPITYKLKDYKLNIDDWYKMTPKPSILDWISWIGRR